MRRSAFVNLLLIGVVGSSLLTPTKLPNSNSPSATDANYFRERLTAFAAPELAPPPTAQLPPPAAPATASPEEISRVRSVFDRLIAASELIDTDGRVILSAGDIETALSDLHLRTPEAEAILPASLYAGAPVDATALVLETLPKVLEAHPIFTFMVEETLGNDDFYKSVYFGRAGLTADHPTAINFAALCKRLVTSIHVFELLIAMDRDGHRRLAMYYEDALREAREAEQAVMVGEQIGSADCAPPQKPSRSLRDALMGFFLAVKGESVLASINAFEMLRRVSGEQEQPSSDEVEEEVDALSRVLNSIMRLNIFEAVLSNLSFAFWPDNAVCGVSLLTSPALTTPFESEELSQPLLDEEWVRTYISWNANFIWPSHYCQDMLCFTMLCMPTIALGEPRLFQYHRAHTLFWVARSTQLTRLANGPLPHEADQIPCFRCRQLEPQNDRQPLTSRTAKRTRQAGERLARRAGGGVVAAAEGGAFTARGRTTAL